MSDPHAKPWLADDPNFIASLNDLDRGLIGGGEIDGDPTEVEPAPAVALPPVRALAPHAPPDAPRSATLPAPPRAARATRPINVARALDPSRVLETAPPISGPVMPPASAPLSAAAAPPFARSSPAEPRARRPLLDLFPASALEPDGPPMSPGTAASPPLQPSRPHPTRTPEADAPSPLDGLTYETFYGLREKPFSLSTDPRFEYQSASHERAGQELLAAIRTRGGPAVLTGPLGLGKTTLCRSLVHRMDRRIVTSLVLEPLESLDDLLKTMLVDFGAIAREELARAAQLSRERLAVTLTTFLESLVALQAGAVVFIDEAQHVPAALLGDLAALLGAPAARGLQLVLVGQPALATLLKQSDLRGLNASVARRTELGPLGADEISSYVMHRLSIAGAHTRIEFDGAAIARLFELSAGSPRVVNLLCDRAMTRGQASSAGVIDGALIEAAAMDLGLQAPEVDRPGLLGTLAMAAAFALLVLAGAAGALWVSRDAVRRTIQQWENVPLPPGGPVRRLPVPVAPIPPPADISDAPRADASI